MAGRSEGKDPWEQAIIDRAAGAFMRGLEFADDMGAIVFGAAALLTLLGLLGLTQGRWVDAWSSLLWRWMGWGAPMIPVSLGAAAYIFWKRAQGGPGDVPWHRVVFAELAFVALLALLSIVDGMSLSRAEAGQGGGIIGWGIATFLGRAGNFGRVPLLLATLGLFGYLALRNLRLLPARRASSTAPHAAIPPQVAGSSASQAPLSGSTSPTDRRSPSRRLPREFRKNFRLPDQPAEKIDRPLPRDERLPPLDLLTRDKGVRVTAREINQTAGIIEKTLADFGIPAHVVGFRTGPTVTQYQVEPGYIEQQGLEGELRRHKVRVAQISALANDLALALSAPRLRIEAPVPGHSYVGIEVPNQRSSIVRLRSILESEAFQRVGSQLAIALGRDVAGEPVMADLIAMPHLLMAGTTGSGKSVCIAALATCLAFNNTPEDLRLVMIDPKMVELLRFNGLPHLLGKVETDLKRIVGVLRWCTAEMDRRYRLLEEAKARDVEVYNRKARRRKGAEPLPRIVIFIDELADLMMMAPDQTEQTLVRLAQMSRATGIHLVVATQRPSTDVVTGLIKANFPARISFAVASGVDSRVILDTPGAETLVGKGDMLYLAPEAGAPQRLQGVFVDDPEIERLIHYWRQTMGTPEGPGESPWETMLVRQEALEEHDEILEQAIELVKRTRRASASMLQRRLRIGYPRAARLMDELEELGIIGRAQSGGRTREVLIGRDDDPFENE